MENRLPKGQYDLEWLELIQEAKEIGLTLEEIRMFLQDITNQEQMNV